MSVYAKWFLECNECKLTGGSFDSEAEVARFMDWHGWHRYTDGSVRCEACLRRRQWEDYKAKHRKKDKEGRRG